MSIACFVAALAAAASVALADPQASSAGDAIAQPFAVQSRQADAHAAPRSKFGVRYYSHGLEVTAESHPVRFHTDATPALKILAADYSNSKPGKVSPALTATKKPKSGIRTYGAITNISENVQAIVDYYDGLAWRPIEMDGGGGVQYRVKFGARETGGN